MLRVVERSRHPHRDRQVELPDPQDVDARGHRDLLHVMQTRLGLDLQDDERPVVGNAHRLTDARRQVIP